jgi:tetratricopeptide (TPR) repeat protein
MTARADQTAAPARRVLRVATVYGLSVLLAAVLVPSVADAALRRSKADEQEIRLLELRQNGAVEKLEQGEALAAKGSIEAAEAVFHEGIALDLDGSLFWRRDCEALTALGRRKEANDTCVRAFQLARSNENMRATVRALVDGPSPPTPNELKNALLVTQGGKRLDGQPDVTSMAALCDIASSLGDGIMLQTCVNALDRLAPDDVEARRGRALLDGTCPPWRFWFGWGAIVAAAIGTAIHSFRTRRTRRASQGALAASLALGVLTFGTSARADDPPPGEPPAAFMGAMTPVQEGFMSKWPVDDQDPEGHIPPEADRDADPIQFGYWLQDVALKGEHAAKRGDHEAAAKYYATLARAVPDRAIGYTKMCDELEAAGHIEKAINVCGTALLHEGLLAKDYVHYVRLVLSRPGPVSDAQAKTLAAVITHMKEDPADADLANDLECQVGVRLANTTMLHECTQALAAKAPNDTKTITYEWSLAIQEGKFADAEKLIEQAKAMKLEPKGLDSMQKATALAQSQRQKRVIWGVLAVVLFAGAVGVGIWNLLSRRPRRGVPASAV